MKRKRCSKCGCFHLVTIQAKIRNNENLSQITTKWLCLECFLKLIGSYDALKKDAQKELSNLKVWK